MVLSLIYSKQQRWWLFSLSRYDSDLSQLIDLALYWQRFIALIKNPSILRPRPPSSPDYLFRFGNKDQNWSKTSSFCSANCNGTTLASQPIDDDRDLFSLPLSLWWNQWIVALWSLFTRNLNLPASEFDNRANWHSDQFTIFNNQPGQLVTTIDINEISNYRVDGHWPARTQIKRLPKTKSLVKET